MDEWRFMQVALALVMASGIISNALFFEGYRNGPDWLTHILFDAVVAAVFGLSVTGISHRSYPAHSRSDIR